MKNVLLMLVVLLAVSVIAETASPRAQLNAPVAEFGAELAQPAAACAFAPQTSLVPVATKDCSKAKSCWDACQCNYDNCTAACGSTDAKCVNRCIDNWSKCRQHCK